MLAQTLASAAVLAALAPNVLAQDAGAPAMVPVMETECATKLSETGGDNSTLSLSAILEDKFMSSVNQGQESVLAPLFEEVSPETLEILDDFDVTGVSSYTLMMPTNADDQGNPLEASFDLNSTDVLANADDIILAHIIPEKISYAILQEETNATGTYTAKSLQGFEWKFVASEDGSFFYIEDEWNATMYEDGRIALQPDINTIPECHNTIMAVKGFMVTPDLLEDVAPAPAPTSGARTLPPAGGAAQPTAPVPVDPVPPSDSAPAPEAGSNGAAGLSINGLTAFSAIGAAVLGAALL